MPDILLENGGFWDHGGHPTSSDASSDTFEFRSSDDTTAAGDNDHKDWIDILSIGKGTHKPGGTVPDEDMPFGYEPITRDVAEEEVAFYYNKLCFAYMSTSEPADDASDTTSSGEAHLDYFII